MIEFKEHIDFYSSKYFFTYADHISKEEWGNIEAAEKFMQQYWLPLSEYEDVWKSKQQALFTDVESLPELIFNDGYEMLATRGGVLFLEEEFKPIQECMLEMGQEYFVVIENNFLGKHPEPMLRMKFPCNITWKELMSGNFISTILFEMYHNEYYLIGENGKWGRYSANDAMQPLNIIGFKPEYAELFRKYFIQPDEEWQEIKDWLPPLYKNKIYNM